MANIAWLEQQLDKMQDGLANGKTRRRKVSSVKAMGISEKALKASAHARGVRVAQIGDDYLFAAANYTIRPL
ncbi:MAG: hypothetical protein O9327_03250 [Polaromonas sp.]|jgi:hypothetical protein|nr:hypothetical protein [Polaromonas sp.]